jgi:5-formyltetrahydrofolate cyclo-ligase
VDHRRTRRVSTALRTAEIIGVSTKRMVLPLIVPRWKEGFPAGDCIEARHESLYGSRQREARVKKELRTKLRDVLTAISAEQIQARSREAARRLFEQGEYRRANTMMIYLSLPHEADTTPIVLQAWQDAKRVVAPQVVWQSRQMVPVEIKSLDDVASNQLGLREPVRGQPIPLELIDLVIVPGLGFDPFGNRLGRGRGFYDRFLGRPEFSGIACGFALEEQFVPDIPAGHLDRRVHMLVTDAAARRFDP